jgi:hypothetical protein
MIAAERAVKDHFVREQRTPFAGGGVIIRRAADEFVPAIGFPDKAGGAECGENVACEPCVSETETCTLKPD